jgi:N-acetylmuramoyl-L-alanine amidase
MNIDTLKNINATLQLGDQSQEVEDLQEALYLLGFDPGAPDGIYGVKTQVAVKQFQESVFVTGSVSPYLAGLLHKRASAILDSNDSLEGLVQVHHQSTHYSNRLMEVDTLIIHYTASVTSDATRRVFTKGKPGNRRSAHFTVNTDGSIEQFVDLDKAAWHAGGGYLPDVQGSAGGSMNSRSIGIEIENFGPLKRIEGVYYHSAASNTNPHVVYRYDGEPFIDKDKKAWASYPKKQLDAVKKLGKALNQIYKFKYIHGHDELLRVFKSDPGPAFPREDVFKAIRVG